MAKRTIETGIGTYQGANGIWTFGSMGDEIDVHADDVERFDRLNVVAQPVAVEPEPATEPVAEKTERKSPAKSAGK